MPGGMLSSEERMSSGEAPRGESGGRPSFGIGRPAFGLTKETGHRVEIVFALKSGGSLPVVHDLGDELNEERFQRFVEELQQQVASGRGTVTFADSWSASGARSWLDLTQVAGF